MDEMDMGEDAIVELAPDNLEVVEEIEVEAVDIAAFDANLAEALDDDDLSVIGDTSQETLQNFKNARTEWEEYIKKAVKWLGVSDEDTGNGPTEDSCTAVHPLLIENVVKFQAKAIQELWPAKGPVRTKLRGNPTPEREMVATRIRNHMNYQLTEQVPGFYNMLERNLFRVGFMGVGIRKVAWNGPAKTPDPVCVPVENFYVDQSVTHLRHAEDHIELIEITGRQMRSYISSGFYKDCGDSEAEETLVVNEITEAMMRAQGFDASLERKGFLIGERHCYLDLHGADPLVPEGGHAPYIVHFNVSSGRIYAIFRNWLPEDASRTKRLWYTVDNFIPAFGFYSLGYAHLIGALTASSSAALRALVDSGQFSNWQAGFKSKRAKFSDSDTPLRFGEFRDVDLEPSEIKDAFFPLPAKEPSQVLFALMQFMVASGQKFADATDEVVQGATNYGPVATTLALIEASQRFYSSIHKRLHQSQHEFLQLIGRLNFENLGPRVEFVVGSEVGIVSNTDYDPRIVDVLPASDPNALSESQRVARAQIELDTARQHPQHHDMREALRRFYVALGTEGIEKLMPDPSANAVTADPLSEIQAAMKGQPIRAQMGQQHLAHIAVKEAFMQSPQMQGTNDPSVAIGVELLKANIAEHKVLLFASQIMQRAQQAGLPPESPEVQGMMAQQMVAESAALGMSGAGPSAEQQMIDLNKAELEVARERLASQDARENAKLAMKQQEIDLKKLTLLKEIQQAQTGNRIESAKVLLDNAAKMASNAREALNERVVNDESSK